MKIKQISEVTGKTRKEIENILQKQDFVLLDLNEEI